MSPRCALCDSSAVRAAHWPTVLFENQCYQYGRCFSCGSLFCDPMPDASVLARMYGPAYGGSDGNAVASLESSGPRVVTVLGQRKPGLFVDFGCGRGSLLPKVEALGWTPVGVEFDREVARRAAEETGSRVLLGLEELRSYDKLPAHVIYLGDVIEHLTAPARILSELVTLLAPGGWFVAEGPLEAGPCLFSAVFRLAHRVRRPRVVVQPPYHVVQASVSGQRLLFERVGLRTRSYRVSEVAWPAPERLTADLIRSPRRLALLVLRRLSQLVSLVGPSRLGNRYFYVGTPA